MSTAYSGVGGNVNSGSTDMDVSGWSADHETSNFDSTTTADLGWEDETPATQKVSGSFDFFYNKNKKPTGSSANMRAGSTPTLTLYVNKADGELLTGLGLIKKLSIKTKTKDGVLCTATFTSKGVWTLPT